MLDMNWGGKIILGFLGLLTGGPFGLLLGLFVGHMLDRSVAAVGLGSAGSQEKVQDAFFTTVFSIMGHLAKADGRVSEQEIAQARAVMDRMQLDETQRKRAIELFNQGKQADFPLDDAVARFYRVVRHRRQMTLVFLEILLQVALADGQMEAEEQQVLLRVAQGVGVPAGQFQQILAMLQAQAQFSAGGGYQHYQGGVGQPPRGPSLAQAYQVLGVSEQASAQEIKKAYRRLMSQHHPDRLAARGVPEEMVRLSSEKTAEISKAYEMVKTARGF